MVAINNMNGDDEPHHHQRQLQAEIRGMLSTLTGGLAALGRSIARSDGGGDAEHGFGIITLAGENKGAMMKADMEELMDVQGGTFDDDNGMRTYTNSNYQAVNNSIILGGSTVAEDPGVHVNIKEYMEEWEEEDGDEEEEAEDAHENKEEKKKKKKKEKEEKKKKKKEKEEEEEKKKKKMKKEEGEDEEGGDEEKEKKKKKEEKEEAA